MGKKSLFLLFLVLGCALFMNRASGFGVEMEGGGDMGGEGEAEGGGEGHDWFLLKDSMHVIKSDAGDMRVVRGGGKRLWRSPMHIGFITMEPNSLFIPQYLDSTLILFIRRGKFFISFPVFQSTSLDIYIYICTESRTELKGQDNGRPQHIYESIFRRLFSHI